MRSFISIGDNCKVRHQIDNYGFAKSSYYKKNSYYFDWLMWGGINGLCYYIENDFQVNLEDFSVIQNKGRFAPYHILSNHVFLHDFGGRGWCTDLEDAENYFREGFDASISKYRHLAEKTLLKLKSKSELYLVFYGEIEACEFDNLVSLHQMKYGREIKLVNVLEKNQNELKGKNVITRYVDDSLSQKKGTNLEWQGDDDQWFFALDF
jgi:hypothetical protein